MDHASPWLILYGSRHFALLMLLGDILMLVFFQAEDGIRDLTVTGVQTCALPIYDRNRTIDFAQLPSGTGQAGSGTFSPSRVSVPRGAQSSATATFRAGSPGKVLIRATAPDLAPTQTLVVIVPHGSSWMDPSAHPTFRVAAYQQDITVEINPHEPTVVPANGVSRAQLWVTLNRRLNPDEELQIRVKSVPGVGVQVLYDGIRQGNVNHPTVGAGSPPS